MFVHLHKLLVLPSWLLWCWLWLGVLVMQLIQLEVLLRSKRWTQLLTGLDGRVWDRTTLDDCFSFFLSFSFTLLLPSLFPLLASLWPCPSVPPLISCSNRSWSSDNVRIVPFFSLVPVSRLTGSWFVFRPPSLFVFRPSCLFVCLNTFGEEAIPRLVSRFRTKLCWRDIGTIVTWVSDIEQSVSIIWLLSVYQFWVLRVYQFWAHRRNIFLALSGDVGWGLGRVGRGGGVQRRRRRRWWGRWGRKCGDWRSTNGDQPRCVVLLSESERVIYFLWLPKSTWTLNDWGIPASLNIWGIKKGTPTNLNNWGRKK